MKRHQIFDQDSEDEIFWRMTERSACIPRRKTTEKIIGRNARKPQTRGAKHRSTRSGESAVFGNLETKKTKTNSISLTMRKKRIICVKAYEMNKDDPNEK